MSYQGAGRVLRKVRVQTASECIAGLLAIGEQVRTLDDINLLDPVWDDPIEAYW